MACSASGACGRISAPRTSSTRFGPNCRGTRNGASPTSRSSARIGPLAGTTSQRRAVGASLNRSRTPSVLPSTPTPLAGGGSTAFSFSFSLSLSFSFSASLAGSFASSPGSGAISGSSAGAGRGPVPGRALGGRGGLLDDGGGGLRLAGGEGRGGLGARADAPVGREAQQGDQGDDGHRRAEPLEPGAAREARAATRGADRLVPDARSTAARRRGASPARRPRAP